MAQDFIDPYEFLGIAPAARSPTLEDVPEGTEDPYAFLGIAPGVVAPVGQPFASQQVTQGRPNDWNYGKQIASGLTLGFGPELYGTQKYLEEGGPLGPLSLSQQIYNQTAAQEAFERENYLHAKPVELISSVPTTVAANVLTPGLSTLAKSPSIAARMGAGALAGAETGVLQSRITGGSPAENALTGGLLQGGMPGASAAAGRLVVPRVRPGIVDIVRKMEALGIKLRPSQVAMSESLRRADELLASGANEKQLQSFTDALLDTVGERGNGFNSVTMGRAWDKITGAMDAHVAQTTVAKDQPLNQGMALVSANLKGLEKQYQDQVRDAIKVINGSFTKGTMDGKIYQRLTERGGLLTNLSRSGSPVVREAGGKLRELLDDAVERSSPPGTREAWAESRAKLKNLIAIQPLVEGNTSGLVDPRKLHAQVKKTFSEYGWGPLPYGMDVLAEGGQLMPRVGPTGEARRSERQRWYLQPSTLFPAGLGAGEYLLLSGNLSKAAAVAAGTAAVLEGEKLGRGAIMRSDWYRNALTGNVSPPSLSGRAVRNALTGAVNELNQFEEEER
jgi:hypothetical protein